MHQEGERYCQNLSIVKPNYTCRLRETQRSKMEVALLSWGNTATPEAAQYRQDPAPRAHSPTSMGAQRIDFLEPLIRHIVDDSSTKHNCSTFKMGGTHFLCLPTLSVYKIGTHFQHNIHPFFCFPASEKLLNPMNFNRVQWDCRCLFYMYFKCWQA